MLRPDFRLWLMSFASNSDDALAISQFIDDMGLELPCDIAFRESYASPDPDSIGPASFDYSPRLDYLKGICRLPVFNMIRHGRCVCSCHIRLVCMVNRQHISRL